MSAEAVKTCSKCGETKPAPLFRKERSQCKACIEGHRRQYRASNREKLNEHARLYYAAHRERIRDNQRKYLAKNREKRAEYARAHYSVNRDRYRKNERNYRAANRKKINEYERQYYAANRDRFREYMRQSSAKLDERYVARAILRNTTLTRADIPPELLEAKRLQLKLKRIAMEAMK